MPQTAAITTLNQPLTPQPIVLVLSGGGGRSFMQVGALQALEDAGFTVAAVAGCSSGSILGACIAAGLTGRELERALGKGDVTGWLNLQIGAGLVGQRGLQQWLEQHLPPCFEDLALPLGLVTTDINTGQEVLFCSGPLVEPVLASSAFTGAMYPRHVAGRWLTDGGLVNEVPADLAREIAGELGGLPVVALDVTSPLKTLSFEQPGNVAAKVKGLLGGDSPLVAEVLRQAFTIAQNCVTQKRIELCPPDWLVSFKAAQHISVLDLGDLTRGTEFGYSIMQDFMDKVQAGKSPQSSEVQSRRVFARAQPGD